MYPKIKPVMNACPWCGNYPGLASAFAPGNSYSRINMRVSCSRPNCCDGPLVAENRNELTGREAAERWNRDEIRIPLSITLPKQHVVVSRTTKGLFEYAKTTQSVYRLPRGRIAGHFLSALRPVFTEDGKRIYDIWRGTVTPSIGEKRQYSISEQYIRPFVFRLDDRDLFYYRWSNVRLKHIELGSEFTFEETAGSDHFDEKSRADQRWLQTEWRTPPIDDIQ
jgi:hypothetical protein